MYDDKADDGSINSVGMPSARRVHLWWTSFRVCADADWTHRAEELGTSNLLHSFCAKQKSSSRYIAFEFWKFERFIENNKERRK